MTHYVAIVVDGKKKDLHRHLMEQKVGRKLRFNEVVHHKDGNKLNNDIDNLEVISRSRHSRMHRLGQKCSDEFKEKMRAKGIEFMPNKLTADQVKEIIAAHRTGTRQADLARSYKVNKTTICDIINRRTWKHI